MFRLWFKVQFKSFWRSELNRFSSKLWSKFLNWLLNQFLFSESWSNQLNRFSSKLWSKSSLKSLIKNKFKILKMFSSKYLRRLSWISSYFQFWSRSWIEFSSQLWSKVWFKGSLKSIVQSFWKRLQFSTLIKSSIVYFCSQFL